MIFQRDCYLNQLIRRRNTPLIKVITGTRRAGKSFLLNELYRSYLLSNGVKPDHIISFAFDNEEDLEKLDLFYPSERTKISQKENLYKVNAKKFRSYISSLTTDSDTYYLLLDEIQILDSFVTTLNGFLNHRNFDVYVTGSSSQMLSSEIETKFRGRKLSLHVLPLSFSEFVSGIALPPEQAWRLYLVTGGIPIVYQQNEEDRRSYLEDLCSEVYLKDIIGRKRIKDSDILADLFDVLASDIGAGVSPSKLEKIFRSEKNTKISDDTISSYIDSFQDAFVVSKAKKYNIKGNAYVNTPFKVYFEDIGVRNARLHFHQIEESHLMENVIYNELRYRGYHVDIGQIDANEMTDRLDINGKRIYKKKELEVDFVATKGDKKCYIQSCINLTDPSTLEREIRSLKYIDDSFQKIIVTKDGLAPRVNENGFFLIDIFDFLLQREGFSL